MAGKLSLISRYHPADCYPTTAISLKMYVIKSWSLKMASCISTQVIILNTSKETVPTRKRCHCVGKNKNYLSKNLNGSGRIPQARSTKAKARDWPVWSTEKIANQRESYSLQINIKSNRLGSKIVEAHNVGKSYGNKKLFSGFSYKFKRWSRRNNSPNGAGKTTLLNILTGGIQPDEGKIVIGDTVVFGWHPGRDEYEGRPSCHPMSSRTYEYIPTDKGNNITAASLLERFLFPQEQQQVYVSQLSGGEKEALLDDYLDGKSNFLI